MRYLPIIALFLAGCWPTRYPDHIADEKAGEAAWISQALSEQAVPVAPESPAEFTAAAVEEVSHDIAPVVDPVVIAPVVETQIAPAPPEPVRPPADEPIVPLLAPDPAPPLNVVDLFAPYVEQAATKAMNVAFSDDDIAPVDTPAVASEAPDAHGEPQLLLDDAFVSVLEHPPVAAAAAEPIVLKVFTAPWCKNCNGKQLVEAAKVDGLEGHVQEVEISDAICNQYRIKSIPTYLLMDGNRVLKRWNPPGRRPWSELKPELEKVIPPTDLKSLAVSAIKAGTISGAKGTAQQVLDMARPLLDGGGTISFTYASASGSDLHLDIFGTPLTIPAKTSLSWRMDSGDLLLTISPPIQAKVKFVTLKVDSVRLAADAGRVDASIRKSGLVGFVLRSAYMKLE